MTIADTGRSAANIAKLAGEKRRQIAADNEANRAARNASRWKAERDPVEYDKQKAEQRAAYADQIADTEGREVRAYVKVPGKTLIEHSDNAKARDAARKRNARKNASEEDKDREADRKWSSRKRKAGWTEQQIAKGLAERATARLYRQPEPEPYEDNPDFGAF